MNEIGLRILLGMICREAAVFEKGIEPLCCYASDHYFRLYVRIRHGKQAANQSMSQYQCIPPPFSASSKKQELIGPLWLGQLQKKEVIQQLRTLLFTLELHTKHTLWKLLDTLEEEAQAPPFFITTEQLASQLKTSAPPLHEFCTSLQKKGYTATRTHFHPTGVKTNAPIETIVSIFTP
jgi:tRNA (guanine26-N2/guanine27-N2)-dimethyltransferase